MTHVSLAGRLERAFVQQDPNRAIGKDIDIENRAAHGDRCVGRVDDVRCFRRCASDEPECALHHVDDDGAGLLVAVVDEFIEHEPRPRAEGELRLVVQPELALRVGVDLDGLVLANFIAFRELALLFGEVRHDHVRYDDGFADSVSRGRLRRSHGGQQQAANADGQR